MAWGSKFTLVKVTNSASAVKTSIFSSLQPAFLCLQSELAEFAEFVDKEVLEVCDFGGFAADAHNCAACVLWLFVHIGNRTFGFDSYLFTECIMWVFVYSCFPV